MGDLNVHCINDNLYAMNSYVVTSEDEAMIIDISEIPFGFDNYDRLLDGKKLNRIIYTHGHFDHISGSDDVRKRYGYVEQGIHELDYGCFEDPSRNLSAMFSKPASYKSPEISFKDGDTFTLKNHTFNVIHTPGHTVGCVCFYTEGYLFCGDTIFANGIGRTDFPGGSYEDIEKSILEKIFTLEDDVLLYPGHNAYGFNLKDRKKHGIL